MGSQKVRHDLATEEQQHMLSLVWVANIFTLLVFFFFFFGCVGWLTGSLFSDQGSNPGLWQ